MFGNILIDKFGIYSSVRKDNITLFEELAQRINDCMALHYPKNAYRCSISGTGKSFKFHFTPTRYYDNMDDFKQFTDVNLDMPDEEIFLNLFEDCGFFDERFEPIVKEMKIGLFHVTKNIVTKVYPEKYLDILYKKSLKYSCVSAYTQKNETGRTLIISNKTQDKTKIKTAGTDRKFIFYNKRKQLLDKANIDKVIVKEQLTDEEVSMLPPNSYNHPALIIKKIQILRCELQYTSTKTKYISNFLLNTKNETMFYLSTFLDLLRQQKLYERLNDFFKAELTKFVFFEKELTDTDDLSAKEKILIHYLDKLDIELLRSIYKDCGYEKHFQTLIKKLRDYNLSEYYKELYQKLLS